jgi:hypothetical protein
MIFEFMNPSDPYHFEAPDLEIAASVTLMLGSGQAAAHCVDDETVKVPLFMFCKEADADKWFVKNVGCTMRESAERLKKNRMPEVVAAFRSFTIGKLGDYKSFQTAMKLIGDKKKQNQYRKEYHKAKLTSLNDYGTYAWKLADELEKPSKKPKTSKKKEV